MLSTLISLSTSGTATNTPTATKPSNDYRKRSGHRIRLKMLFDPSLQIFLFRKGLCGDTVAVHAVTQHLFGNKSVPRPQLCRQRRIYALVVSLFIYCFFKTYFLIYYVCIYFCFKILTFCTLLYIYANPLTISICIIIQIPIQILVYCCELLVNFGKLQMSCICNHCICTMFGAHSFSERHLFSNTE